MRGWRMTCIAFAHAFAGPRAERQPLRLDGVGDQPVQTGLVDRHLAPQRPRDLAVILVMQTTSWPNWAKHAPDTSPT